MKRVFQLLFFAPLFSLGQDSINKLEKKTNYGISTGVIFFPGYGKGYTMWWHHSFDSYEDGIRNLFFESRPFLPVAEFFYNKRENFHHLIGGSFSYKKIYVDFKNYTTSLEYRGIYIYYQNQLLFRKYTKGWFIKHLYTGGRFIVTGKEAKEFGDYQSGPIPYNEKNIMGALGITFGYKKIWDKFYLDFGMNRSVLAAGKGEYFPDYKNLFEKGKYSVIMTPFDDLYLRPFETKITSVTFNLRIGYRIK